MDTNMILAAVSKMFPSIDVSGAMQQAQQAIQGTPDTLEGAAATLKKMGINQATIDSIYNKYGNTMQARAICGMLGTTPQALKSDADKLVSSTGAAPAPFYKSTPSETVSSKFPRLK